MKMNSLSKAAVAVILISAPSIVLSTVTWSGKTVGQLISTYDGADCIYFTLEGVAEADPIAPGSPWFAIPRTQYGAKDAYAMLLAAKLNEKPVSVFTTGTLSCGYASVAKIIMQ